MAFPMDSPSPPLRSGRVLFTAAPSPISLVPSRSSQDVVELGVATVAVVAVVAVALSAAPGSESYGVTDGISMGRNAKEFSRGGRNRKMGTSIDSG